MKKKGFTLIELLAVIVILAVIALIVTPIIGDLIEGAKKSTAIRSIDGYISAANDAAAISLVSNDGINLTNEKFEFETGNDDAELAKISVKGNVPKYIYLKYDYNAKRVTEGKFCINDYSVDYIDGLGSVESNTNYCGEGMSNAGLAVNITDKDILINLSSRPEVIEYCVTTEHSIANCTWNIVRNHMIEYVFDDSKVYYIYGRNSEGRSIYLYTLAKNTNPNFCDVAVGEIWYFQYDSTKLLGQKFSVPCDGTYKIELWGAGTETDTSNGGAYTSGNISLSVTDDLYFYVGERGYLNETNNGRYNGGGAAEYEQYNNGWRRSGGGATDVRYFGRNYNPTDEDLAWDSAIGLNSRIMVAGGAGAAGVYDGCTAGAAGGLTGYNGGSGALSGYAAGSPGIGGTQTSSNGIATFGQGGGGTSYRVSAGAGGGGYYGGGAGVGNYAGSAGGGGGSSYISGHAGCIAINENSTTNPRAIKDGCSASSTTRECSIHYSGMAFIENTTTMVDGKGYAWTIARGGITRMPTYDGTSTMTNNTGNGYAKITYISE